MKTVFLTLTLVAMVLDGCTNGTFNLRKTVDTSIHIRQLNVEFDRAVAAARATPLLSSVLSGRSVWRLALTYWDDRDAALPDPQPVWFDAHFIPGA